VSQIGDDSIFASGAAGVQKNSRMEYRDLSPTTGQYIGLDEY